MSRRRPGPAQATPDPIALPPALPPSEIVLKLRKDVRIAQISQFVLTFGPHVNLDFDIDDLEADLEGSRPGCCIPTLLGKLCNTLANDRNTNSSNWMMALRRAYNRRLPKDENPFYRYVRVPITADEDNQETSSAPGKDEDRDATPRKKDEGQDILKGAAPAMIDSEATPRAPAAHDTNAAPPAEPVHSTKEETPQAPLASTTPAPPTPTLLDSVNVKLERDETEGFETREGSYAFGAGVDTANLDYYEDRIDVEWSEVDLEAKVAAIYNICHWHMNDAERFRRHLKYEDDLSWRIDPIGTDAKRNEYYFLDDHRLWIHRAPPPRKSSGSAKSKGKGRATGGRKARKPVSKKAKPAPKATATKKRPRSPEPAPKPVESPSKRARTTRGRTEEWEAIPEELMKEWEREATAERGADSSRKDREVSEGASSALTSLGDENEDREEEEADEKPSARPRPRYKKEDAVKSDEEEEELEEEEEIETEEESELEQDEASELEGEVEEDGEEMMKWERDFWAERERIQALENFVEWEAICVTRKEWQEFVDKILSSKNRNERHLYNLLKEDILPEVLASIEEKEKEQLAELIAFNRKRSTRIATKESEEDEKARLAAERAAEASKLSRASRHKIIANLNINGEDPTSDAGSAGKGGPQETREERFRKREEEKRAKEAAAEAAQIEQIKKMEREAALASNGGVGSPGLETKEDEEKTRVKAEEEEAQRREKEQASLHREAEEKKVKSKAVKAAPLPPPAPLLVKQESDEPPWYFDCEICKDAGWNLDDGQVTIACDRCDEWQHLDCHVKANAVPGRPPIDFGADDFSFICARCRANPHRPKRVPPPNLPPPLVYVAAPPPPPPPSAKRSRPKKEPPPPPKPAPLRPTPEERKAQRGKPPAPASSASAPPSARTNGSSSVSSKTAPAPAASSPASGIPGPGQPPLSYDALKALIEAQPVLINQLPPQYQTHFSGLLGIPVPYPTNG